MIITCQLATKEEREKEDLENIRHHAMHNTTAHTQVDPRYSCSTPITDFHYRAIAGVLHEKPIL